MRGAMQHPFAGRKGSKQRTLHAVSLFASQMGKCKMCGRPVDPSLKGKTDPRACVVDHIVPWRLTPDTAHDRTNLQLVCRCCHGLCHSIEQRYWPDGKAIARMKMAKHKIGIDGWRE